VEYLSPFPIPSLTVFSASQQSTAGFNQELVEPATDALDPIIVVTIRGAGITAAAATRLTHHLFALLFRQGKRLCSA